MTTRANLQEFIRTQTDKWNRHDAATVAQGYASNATVVDPAYPEALKGRDAVQKDASDFFTAMPDARVEIENMLENGDSAAFEVHFTGTHSGPLPLPTGVIPPTNRKLDFRVGVFIKMNGDGTIQDERRYYDVAGQLTQLGLVP